MNWKGRMRNSIGSRSCTRCRRGEQHVRLELGLEEPTQFAGHTHRWILLGLSIDGDDKCLGEDDDVVQLAHEQGAHRKAQASNMVARKTMEINPKDYILSELRRIPARSSPTKL